MDEQAASAREARLIMLPGMGTQARLLEPQRRAFPTLQTPDWIACRHGESLGEYARRLLETVDPTPPVYLGGVSFGGMLALEMAAHCKAEAVLLIGSARSGLQVPGHFRTTARVGRRMPMWMMALLPRTLIRLHFAWRERLNREQIALLRRATQGVDRELFRWTGDAIARWHFDRDPGCPVYQLHGRRDWILKPPPRGEGVELIEEGRHMINLTHVGRVNAFIHRHAPLLPYKG